MMLAMNIQVTKASGETVDFDEAKLARSLRFARVPDDVAKEAIEYVKGKLVDKIATHLIYAYVSGFLRRRGYFGQSYNYDLKRAIIRLGPTGYPFEEFIAKILTSQGYQTKVGVTLIGKCVSHEIDIEASNASEHFFIECKFHNQLGVKTDVQVALYTQARFEDIKASPGLASHQKDHKAWLVTNTAVTKDVIDYAQCVGMQILSWGFPEGGSLSDLIINAHLHPITVLQDLRQNQLNSLFERGIVSIDELKQFLTKGELPQNFTKSEADHLLAEIKAFE